MVKWVTIEDRIYNITGILHPGGRYILNNLTGRDITREYYGINPMVYENLQSDFNLTITHSHARSTHSWLNDNCLGNYKSKNFIISTN